jgi:hypothetical protein
MAKPAVGEYVPKTFNGGDFIDKLVKLNTPVLRKRKPKPGSMLKKTDVIVPGVEMWHEGKWWKIDKNSIAVGFTVAYVENLDGPRKYRYPLR